MPASLLLKPGATAPPFHLLDQAGQIATLENTGGAQGTVLLFFASHFLPGDLQALKAFSEASPRFLQAGFTVAAISGLNWETLHHLGKQLELPYRVLFDPCCKVSMKYGTMLIPKFVTGRAVYAINPSGRVITATKQMQPQALLKQLQA